MTEWRICPNFPDYEVSERGDVRRLTPAKGAVVGKVMTPYVREDGYCMFILRRDEKSFHKKAHQLVAEAFIGPKPFDGAEVCHIDGSRCNDHYSNLRWGTSADNKADMVLHGTRRVGSRHHNAKFTEADIAEMFRLRREGMLQREIGERFGMRQADVSRILTGKRWKHAA